MIAQITLSGEAEEMNKRKMFIVAVILFSSVIIVFAQSNRIQNIPQGMEMIEINGEGGGQLIVPKGAKTRKVGAQIIVEGTKEYMSRRFYEMEERLAKMEKAQGDLEKEVVALKEIAKKVQEKF